MELQQLPSPYLLGHMKGHKGRVHPEDRLDILLWAEGGQPVGCYCVTGSRQVSPHRPVCLGTGRLRSIFRNPCHPGDSVCGPRAEGPQAGAKPQGYRVKGTSADLFCDSGSFTCWIWISSLENWGTQHYLHEVIVKKKDNIWYAVQYNHTESLNLCALNSLNIYL